MYFRMPSSILVAGPSGCGKTHFVKRLLANPRAYFRGVPSILPFCYGAKQKVFEEMAMKNAVKFHEGVPTVEDLSKWYGKTNGGILVLDDLMEEGERNKFVLDLFTKHSHHRNVTVLYLCQDLFPPGKFAKSISRNAHYIVAFKNPCDKTGLRSLLIQAFPTQWEDVMHTFEKVTEKPFGYMMLDLHPHSSDKYRVWASLLKDERPTRVFVRKPKGETERHGPRMRFRQCIDTQRDTPYRDASGSIPLWCEAKSGPRLLTTNTSTKQRYATVLPRTARRRQK